MTATAGLRPRHSVSSRSFLPARSRLPRGNYGWLYRNLAPWHPPPDKSLRALSERLFDADRPIRDNPCLPAAYTYLGQLVDHDLTFDPTSVHQRQNDPDALHNYRTPAFDLDCLYGRGPDDQPYLYEKRSPYRLLTGRSLGGHEYDLPRNLEGAALTGDPRNDENVLLSQLHTVFIEFHSRALDYVESEERLAGREAFDRARTLVRWHYQWVVVHDFLRRILDPAVRERLRSSLDPEAREPGTGLRHFQPRNSAYIPVEFSAAVYRFGHSMIRGAYALNPRLHQRRDRRPIPIFAGEDDEDLRGGSTLPGGWRVDWTLFLDFGGDSYQRALRIDTRLNDRLQRVPLADGQVESLAYLDLLRGVRYGLPSGQALAKAMGLPDVLEPGDVGLGKSLEGETPLWIYVLKEAEIQQDGLRLGRLASEIVGEVFLGLLRLDPLSYFAVEPRWKPVFGRGERFELKDLILFATHGWTGA